MEMNDFDPLRAFVKEKTDLVEKSAWSYESDRNINIRQVVKAVLLVRERLSSRDPTLKSETLAWVGICLFLPALLEPLTDSSGQEDLFDLAGVEDWLVYLLDLINRVRIIQEVYHEQAKRSLGVAQHSQTWDNKRFEQHMIQLCSRLFNTQAEAVHQLLEEEVSACDSPLRRLVTELKKTSTICSETFHVLDDIELKERFAQQETHMNEPFLIQRQKWQKKETTRGCETSNEQSQGSSQLEEEQGSLDECLDTLHTTAYETAISQIPDPTPGTCRWVLQHPTFNKWLYGDTSSNILWVSANQGFGKSVFVKSLLEDKLHHRNSDITCYFMFDSKSADRRNVENAVSALLHQSCSQNRTLLMKANQAFRFHGANKPRSFIWLWELFISLVRSLHKGTVFCLLDALDVCDDYATKS